MANVLDNNASVFKPKKDEQKKIETPVIKQASIPAAVTGALRALSTGTSNTTPFTKNTSASVSPTQNTKATQEYEPGALSMRVIVADRQQGKDWSNASEEQKAYNNTYYRTLDDKKHTDMVLGLEGMRGNYGDKNWQTSFDTQYKAGQEYLKKELEDAEKKYGKDSYEYKALERFSQDYENTARWTVKGQADYALNASSKQTDDAIRTIYSGVIGRPDFYEKAAAGEKEAGKKYRSELTGASDLQKALWYYTYHESGKDGVKELEKNFLGNSVNYQRAIADFASDIDNEDKFTRFWEANKANFASAMDQTFGGIRQAFTNTEADPNDRTLSGDYTISDSVDDYLRAQLGGTVSDETLQKYGSEGFTQLSSIGADWVKDASKDASDFQKNLIGYLYRANGNDAEIAKSTWEDIKSQSDTFWQMAKGSGTLATGAGTIEGALYRDYLGLAGMKAPAWMGNAEGGEELTAAQALWDAAQTTRAQYPQIAANIIGGLVNPVAGMVLGAAVMSTSVYGNTYKQAIDEGYSKKQAIAYGVAQAASEFGTDMLLSGIAPYAGALTSNAGRTLVRNISNPFLKAVTTAGVDALGEGVQEYLQEQLDPVFRNIIFGENNAIDLASPESVYSFFLGTVSALLMSPLGGVKTVKTNHMYKELGNMLINQDATSKMVDVILNSDLKIEKKSLREQYETAKSIAQDIKSGKVKPNALILGEMFTNAAESGVDVKWLTDPATVNYNKDTLTEENFIAGATSRLAELGADTTLAGDIARWAMGQAPSQEAFNKIKSDPRAAQVLQELIDPLDMEKDNALTRAVQSTTRDVTGNKTYDTLVASNPDQTVVNPATQQLISLGVELEEAQGIGDVIAKVMSGESITEDEAELISVSNAAVRSVLSEVAGVELSENATIGAVMDALNAVATEAADTKAKQAAVAEGAEAAARARMPIPPNTRQTITAGGIEFSHDEFIRDYMAQHNATLEQAEEAWAQRAGISAALNGEEENNGTTSGKQEGRNPGLAGRGPIPAAQERTAGSGRSDVSGTDGGTQTSGQRPAGAVQENEITKFNSEQREFIQDGVSDGFTSVSLVNGPILVAGVDENGNPITFEVNARVDSNGKLTIRWDNPYASPVSIANHERIHRWLDMVFGLHNPERTAFVMNFLNEAFDGNEAALQEMYDKYSEQYGAAYSKYSPQEAAAAIYEEIFSDMYAGLDMYDAGTTAFQEQAEMYVMQEGLREQALGEETENEAGNKFSVSVTGPNGEIIGTLDYDDDVSPNRIANDIRHYRETGELRQDGPNAPYERWKRAAASGIEVGVTVDRKTQSAAPSDFRYSLATWKKSDYVTDVENAARELSEVLDVSITKARAYINTLNSVAKAIADDKTRLDYEASPGVSALIGNTEYGGSIDFSTICKKRRLITGTFTAIQRALPNTALTAEEVLTIRKMMDERGYEVNCGLCYVEGSRAKMGEYAKQFLNEYAKTDPAYLPNMAEINTPEGIEQIRLEHPDIYAAYEKFMNKLAQRKPKLYQMATAYDGEVLHKFEDKQKQVEKYNRNGGLRLQSFSDFEIIHLLDNMQVIIDMARVGLFGQAYTKVPEFAWAMGKTGLKINLSLIAKGVDANGRLLLDEKEGMKRADVDALRKAYPDTVGSIVVVFNNEQLLAAMADPFIDYIIPFHRSQWNQKLYDLMGLPEGAKDFTMWQNESYIEPVYSESGKPQRPPNYMPNTYWDYNKTGKENAETYLQMCAANNRLPKFSFLLNDNGDGSYSLKEDGSTDGYWKLLIDFKMYDNDGKGVPQRAVEPIFNEGPESDPRTVLGMLKAYEGGHRSFPVAEDVVEDFVREYKADHPTERYSLAPVAAVEPKSDSWNRTHTTEETMEIYPDLWNVSAEESETRNPTQIASTQGTYRNIYKILQDQGFDGKILDASSGLGIGTQIGRDEFGFDVEDIEPYPGENYSPMYTDYSKLNKKYDAIISSAVLNVLPQDQRDALVVKMGELLNDGGKMYITTRGKDVDSLAKTGKNIRLGPMEWIETVRGSYQKGFTQNELKAYLKDALGPGFTVEFSNKSNGGKFNNNTSIVVTKNGAARNEAETPQERYSMVDKQFNDWAPEFYSKMERVVNDWTNSKGQPLSAKMAANQVVGWLKGKGVKSEEIKWSGIVPYLEGKKTVTKEELQQVMAENEVKIETKVLDREFDGEGHYYQGLDPRDGSERDIADVDALFDYIDELTKDLGLKPGTLVPKPDPYDASVNVINRSTGELITHIQYQEPSVIDNTHWGDYILDGGENYREILFKMPSLGGYTNNAMRVHWGEADVIAHARVQDMGDADGGRVLFVEEIQSDLHNEGTSKGFSDADSSKKEAARKERIAELNDKLNEIRPKHRQALRQSTRLGEDIIKRVNQGDHWHRWEELTEDERTGFVAMVTSTANAVRDWIRGRNLYPMYFNQNTEANAKKALSFLENRILTAEDKAEIESIRNPIFEFEEITAEQQELMEQKKKLVPDAPFAGSSDTYHEFVMKHLLRLAAEGDYDAIAWTTAQQQSDRWSDEYAEGYRIEYDQNLPKFMNKYGKQWGAKVGSTVLDTGEEVWSVDITPEMKDSVLHEGQPRFSVAPTNRPTENFATEEEWRDAVANNSVEYTPEMEEYWGLSGGDMVDCDAAICEMLDRFDEIHKKKSWFTKDITNLWWYKEGFTDFIDLLKSDFTHGPDMIRFMIRNLDERNLSDLKWFPIQALDGETRKTYRKYINQFNKIIDTRIEEVAAQKGIGRNLHVSSRKEYTLSDIRSMFDELNADAETAAIADKVFSWAEKMEAAGYPIPFKFKTLEGNGGEQLGGKVRYNTAYFNDPSYSDTRKAQTLLHEIIHVYSADIIELVKGYNNWEDYSRYSNGREFVAAHDSIPQDVVEAVKTLDQIWGQIRYDPLFTNPETGKRMYGTKSTSEMIAELANPEFREALKKKSLLQKILDAVKKLFGIDTTNAYDAVSAGFDKLMTATANPDFQTANQKYNRTHSNFNRFSVAPTDENSTPFKEGSLEATVSDLIQKADDGQALQDTINALIEKRNESLKRDNAPVIPSKDKARPVGKVQREIQQNQLQDLINKYGALKKGEKAAKDVTLPERTSDERYTRRFVRNTEEAAGIPERMNERIDDSLLTEDLLTYSRITDKMAIKKGDGDFESLGYKKAIKEWNENRAGTGHQPTKYDIAFGERLMIEAARNGDEAVALKVLADLASMETQAGQVVQAARLLKKLGPTGQLYYIQKAVDRLNKQNEGRIAKGGMQPITIDKELAKAVILSETDEQMKDAMDELIANIAEQLPVTLKDKWDAWRYLSMLGNPRTHIRNVFGNAVFSPIRFTKDLLASAGEKMFIKDPLERTKAADARLGSKKYDAVREFAASDFEEMKQQITGTGKMNPLNEIMDKRKIFKSKAFGWLNKLSDWNSDMLEKEDAIFLRKAYIDAMTQFIAAKGLTLEQLTGSYEGGKILNDARQYAALEAQKATYRDFNQMASALNQMKRTSGVGWFIDGLMPFTKTPMNILRRGIEYSPVGLANGIYSSLVRVGKGDISAAGAIDQIAAGMTGTGIAILGYFLAKMGLARGGDDDDEKKAQLEAAEGHQNYSLEIPGYGSYTIDWMAPVALPFFVGVEVFNQLSDGGPVTGWDLANAMTMIAEPMMSLSMLDGLNSTLSAVRYGDKDEAVMSVATNILTSYLSQGAPTIFGQIARTFDADRRSTYTDKNSATPAWLQRFVQGVQGKVPGAESRKMAYVDAWGRKDTNASLFWRAVENFISPGYANRINETPVDRELTRLAESLGDTSVLPSSISKYYQLNGERLDLNAKQYEKLKTVTGQTAFSLLGNMMDDVAYIAMGDEQKAAVVKQIMSISAAIGKQAVTPDYKPDAWIQRAIDQDNLETAAVYHALKGMDTGLSDYQLISAMDWLTDEDRGTLIMEARDNTSRNMTDYKKKKYKFVLTDEQIAREREIYNDLFWPEYANLINDPKYINAGVAERANMISKMQAALGEAAKRQLGDELRAAGYTSVLLDDSDVPEQVTNLYTLLNRG